MKSLNRPITFLLNIIIAILFVGGFATLTNVHPAQAALPTLDSSTTSWQAPDDCQFFRAVSTNGSVVEVAVGDDGFYLWVHDTNFGKNPPGDNYQQGPYHSEYAAIFDAAVIITDIGTEQIHYDLPDTPHLPPLNQ